MWNTAQNNRNRQHLFKWERARFRTMSTFNYYSVTKKIFINIYCVGIAHLW